MTADRATLKAAVLQAIPDGTAIACHGDADRLADTIVDAVTAVVEEGVTVEWGYKLADGYVGGLSGLLDEKTARGAARRSKGVKTIRRRVTAWEEVP